MIVKHPSAETVWAEPAPLPKQLYYVLKSMRPKQWTKSGIVFMALVFSVHEAWTPEDIASWSGLLVSCIATAVAFSLASGGDYLINDIRDRDKDRLHPKKRNRPIAAGLLSTELATVCALLVDVVALAIAFLVEWRVGLVLVSYIALMLAYSFSLKYQVILDVMVIAAGFVLRAMAGAYAIDVPTSPWLYVVAALGALFLAITKRRAEIQLLADDGAEHRSTLGQYSPGLVDQMTSMVTASTLLAYALYTFDGSSAPAGNHLMMLTIPFVGYGLLRYLYLSLVRNEGGSPEEVLLKDVPLILTIVGWVASSMFILTLSR